MANELTRVAQDSARGSFFLVSGAAVSTVVLAISSILIARFLGPDLYGQYALALIVPQLLYVFTDLGISQGIIKFAASLRSTGQSYRILTLIKHGLIIRAAIGIITFFIIYIFADIIATFLLQRPDLTFFLQLSSVSVLFQVVFTTGTSVFVGLDKAEYNAIATNIQSTAKTVVSIALILAGFGITGAIVGYTLSYVVAALGASILLWIVIGKNRNWEHPKILRSITASLAMFNNDV